MSRRVIHTKAFSGELKKKNLAISLLIFINQGLMEMHPRYLDQSINSIESNLICLPSIWGSVSMLLWCTPSQLFITIPELFLRHQNQPVLQIRRCLKVYSVLAKIKMTLRRKLGRHPDLEWSGEGGGGWGGAGLQKFLFGLDPPLRRMIFQSVTQAALKKRQVFIRSRTDDLGFIFSCARPTISKEKIEVLWAGQDKLILPLMSRWVISLECR